MGEPLDDCFGRDEPEADGGVDRGDAPASRREGDTGQMQRLDQLFQKGRCRPAHERLRLAAQTGFAAAGARPRSGTCRSALLGKAHGSRPLGVRPLPERPGRGYKRPMIRHQSDEHG